jgi:hypothetical protein
MGGKATLKTSALPAGSASITAMYGGHANFVTSTSAALTQSVNQDATTTKLTSSLNLSTSGQSVTFSATISARLPGSGTPTGLVTFYVNSTSVGSFGLTAGVASCTTTFTAVGTYTVKAVYDGDTNFKANIAALTQTVESGSDALVTSSMARPVDAVLGALSSDYSSDALIDDLAPERAAMKQWKLRFARKTRHTSVPTRCLRRAS